MHLLNSSYHSIIIVIYHHLPKGIVYYKKTKDTGNNPVSEQYFTEVSRNVFIDDCHLVCI